MKKITLDILRKQNAETSALVLNYFKNNRTFLTKSDEQTKMIVTRDEQDDLKLGKGIQVGIDRGTLKPPPEQKYKEIDVLGRSPQDIAKEIVEDVGDAAKSGCVIVLVGLSGTGKGTTVSTLSSMLPNCVTWSNGNIFRSFTLLACTKAGTEEKVTVDSEALSADSLKSFTEMISFDEYPGRGFDIKISGLGLDHFVNDVKNTVLKSAMIGQNIPTVAEVTQGEAIMFAKKAINVMTSKKVTVLLEGREQTVNFIETPYRYCLKLSDKSVIGQRRVAQLVAASALKEINSNTSITVEQALDSALSKL